MSTDFFFYRWILQPCPAPPRWYPEVWATPHAADGISKEHLRPPSLLLGLFRLLLVLQCPSPINSQRHRRVVFACVGTTPSRNYSHETHRLSCGRVDGVAAAPASRRSRVCEAVCVAAPSGRHARSAAAGSAGAAPRAASSGARPAPPRHRAGVRAPPRPPREARNHQRGVPRPTDDVGATPGVPRPRPTIVQHATPVLSWSGPRRGPNPLEIA